MYHITTESADGVIERRARAIASMRLKPIDLIGGCANHDRWAARAQYSSCLMPEFRESNDAQSMYDLIRTALDKTYSFSSRKFEHECAFEHASCTRLR